MTLASHAQNNEDLLLARLFPPGSKGFYIDVGANHPVTNSVTKLFYDAGWRGINVEPIARMHQLLLEHRPGDVNLHAGVSDQAAMLTFFEIQDRADADLNGFSHFNPAFAEHQRRLGYTVLESAVSVLTLKDVCEKYVTRPIDFIKIDVEGFERQVIQGADFVKFRPRCLVIEDCEWGATRARFEWQPMLEAVGYRLAFHDGVNCYFVEANDNEAIKVFEQSLGLTRIQSGTIGSDASSPRRKTVLLVSTVFKDTQVASHIGREAYSYFFVYKAFKPLLEKYCLVREVAQPERRLDFAAASAKEQGLLPIHLSFLPLQMVYVSSTVPTIAFPFWEFPDLPNRTMLANARHDWVRVGNLLAGVITACRFTRQSFIDSGVRRPVTVLPVPVSDHYFDIAPWDRARTWTFECVWSELSWDPAKDRARVVAEAIERASGPRPLTIQGILFTSIFNPFDGRKNWTDLLSAAVIALADKPDATIVIKLVVIPEQMGIGIQTIDEYIQSLRIPMRCRLVVIASYLSEADLSALTQASAFYVNASRAEGACLPLQNFLAAARPAISPDGTAMADYFDADVGMVVASSLEPTFWPHDNEKAITTRWHRIDWDSLRIGILAAYRTAGSGDGRYQRLAEAARLRLRDYASREAIAERLPRALDALIDGAADVLPRPSEVSEPAISILADDQGEPIYFDVSVLLTADLTGIGRFTARLMESVARIRPIRLFTVLQAGAPIPIELNWGTQIEVSREQFDSIGPIDEDVKEWVRRITLLPITKVDPAALGKFAGVFPATRPPTRIFRREIGIFYDFTPLLLSETHSRTTIEQFSWFFGISSALYDSVIAISRSTRSDARWLSTFPPSRVVARYPGPSLCVHRHAYPRKVIGAGKVILVVSALEPRKNGPFLLDWFLNTKVVEPGTELWWVGPRAHWTKDAHMEQLQQMALGNDDRQIKFLGWVTDSELCRLYQSSLVSIYPSLYEGFGFPVLDSLVHGTQVITSQNSSLQEFNLPGVHFFDPCDPASLDAAFARFLKNRDQPCADRPDLDRRYSWDRMARTIVQLSQ